jgi:hypothetical protein
MKSAEIAARDERKNGASDSEKREKQNVIWSECVNFFVFNVQKCFCSLCAVVNGVNKVSVWWMKRWKEEKIEWLEVGCVFRWSLIEIALNLALSSTLWIFECNQCIRCCINAYQTSSIPHQSHPRPASTPHNPFQTVPCPRLTFFHYSVKISNVK